MRSVNKQSLREAFDQLKSEFWPFSDDGKVTAEVCALFCVGFVLVELLVDIFMEKQTKKNSNNASMPFSQTNKDETATGIASNGKGKRQNGACLTGGKYGKWAEKALNWAKDSL